jgi:hypothetical protein
MKKPIHIDLLRKRLDRLIEAIKWVPAKRRSTALNQLLADLQRAAAEYDSDPEAAA